MTPADMARQDGISSCVGEEEIQTGKSSRHMRKSKEVPSSRGEGSQLSPGEKKHRKRSKSKDGSFSAECVQETDAAKHMLSTSQPRRPTVEKAQRPRARSKEKSLDTTVSVDGPSERSLEQSLGGHTCSEAGPVGEDGSASISSSRSRLLSERRSSGRLRDALEASVEIVTSEGEAAEQAQLMPADKQGLLNDSGSELIQQSEESLSMPVARSPSKAPSVMSRPDTDGSAKEFATHAPQPSETLPKEDARQQRCDTITADSILHDLLGTLVSDALADVLANVA